MKVLGFKFKETL